MLFAGRAVRIEKNYAQIKGFVFSCPLARPRKKNYWYFSPSWT